jgi:ubiquinol-cytochrome c reductase cytochrome b subunit
VSLVNLGSIAPWSPVLADVMLPADLKQSLTPNAALGATAFEQKGCINCHRIADVGGQRGPDLTHVGGRLTIDELTSRILNGGRNMPAYASELTPQDTNALVEFLASRK